MYNQANQNRFKNSEPGFWGHSIDRKDTGSPAETFVGFVILIISLAIVCLLGYIVTEYSPENPVKIEIKK